VKLGFNGSTITPYRYLFYRFVLASILSLPFILGGLLKVRKRTQAVLKISAIELLGTTVALSFLYIGLHQTSSLIVNMVATTIPVFVTIGGIFFLKEREEKHEWVGMGISLVATLVLVWTSLQNDPGDSSASFLGTAYIVAYNIVTIIYVLLAKKYYAPYPKLFISGISFVVGAISFGFLSLFEAQFHGTILATLIQTDLSSPLVLFVIGYAAVFGSIIGLTAYIKGQDGVEASEASLFSYLQPAIYIPLGYFLLREQVSFIQVISLLVIIVGVYIAERRTKTHHANRIRRKK
jgi:drug/metabolite transporter (DMT)-like permease